MWKQVTVEDIPEMLSILSSEEPVYKGEKGAEAEARYKKTLDRGDELWWWKDPKFTLLLGLRVQADGIGKVWKCVPVGTVTGSIASQTVYDKCCERFEELGVEEFYATSLGFARYNTTGAMRAMLKKLKSVENPNWINESAAQKEKRFHFRKK